MAGAHRYTLLNEAGNLPISVAMPRRSLLLVSACFFLCVPGFLEATPLAAPNPLRSYAVEEFASTDDGVAHLSEVATSDEGGISLQTVDFNENAAAAAQPSPSEGDLSQRSAGTQWFYTLCGCAAVGLAAFRAGDGQERDASEGDAEA
jgi:hypothetical protein